MGYREIVIFKKWSTVIGSCFLMIPIGLPYYWGNMSTYTLSYFLMRVHTKTGLETQWVINLFYSCTAIGLVLVGILSKRTGKRAALLCGILIFLSGLVGTYFILNTSVIVMNLTLGILSGIGGGFINGMALEYAVSWSGKHIGLVTALVQSGFNTGPIVINTFITMYTNPKNESPDIRFGPAYYFSQQDILDNVPYSYLAFGCLCLGFQAIGFVMVQEYTGDSNEEKTINQNSPKAQYCKEQSIPEVNIEVNVKNEEEEKSLTPKEMIKTVPFYGLWFSCLCYSNSIVIICNYYKSYGQLWIASDRFLTMLGTAFTASVLVFGPIWGTITDHFGVKKSFVLMYSITPVYVFFLYFSPMLSKWLFLAGMILYGSTSCPIYFTLITATCKLFGKRYHSSNIGIVISSDLIMTFVTPPVMEMVLLNCGWFYLLCLSASLNIAGLLLVLFTLPEF